MCASVHASVHAAADACVACVLWICAHASGVAATKHVAATTKRVSLVPLSFRAPGRSVAA